MPAIFNVKGKARTDADGNVQRQKYQGVIPVSMAYGLYLGESVDDYGNFKAFFLMNSFVPGIDELMSPSELRSNPRMVDIPLELLPFSKKFTVTDDLIELLTANYEYWFMYTTEPISKPINGKMTTYEQLNLICVADISGPDGIRTILPLLKLKSTQSQPSS
jgi:hypothetical protein